MNLKNFGKLMLVMNLKNASRLLKNKSALQTVKYLKSMTSPYF